jgi:hypothetical protein
VAEKSNATISAKKPANGKISKMEAVRQALATLGNNAYPVAIQKYVKRQYGFIMTTAHVSNYKTDILRKLAGKLIGSAAKSSPRSEVATMLSAPANGKPASISLQDIETTKALLSRVGAKNLKTLIDLLSA